MQLSNSQIFLVVFAVTALIALLAVFFVLIIARFYKTRIAGEIKLYKSVIKTQELERERIGRNLHDEFGALLAGIKLNIDSLTYLKDTHEIEKITEQTKSKIDEALKEVRKIVNDMVPYYIEKSGLIPAFEKLANEPFHSKNIKINFSFKGNAHARFHKAVEIDLYRIAQELLNNSLKHSQGSLINLDLEINDKKLLLHFNDNGQGFVMDEKPRGMGLGNLKTRIDLYQGTVDFKSETGKGTRYDISFSLDRLN